MTIGQPRPPWGTENHTIAPGRTPRQPMSPSPLPDNAAASGGCRKYEGGAAARVRLAGGRRGANTAIQRRGGGYVDTEVGVVG